MISLLKTACSSFTLGLLAICLQQALSGCAQLQQEPPKIAPTPPAKAEASESIDTSCSYFYFLWGTHAESTKKYTEAQEAYENALICDPDADYVLHRLPVLLIKMEKHQAAAQWLREAIKKNPEDIDSQLLLARLAVNNGDTGEAISIYEQILQLAPDNSSVRLRLGYLYTQQGRYKEGETTVRTLLKNDPNSYYALLFLARLAVQSGDHTTAATLYEKILPENWSIDLATEMAEFYSMKEQYKRVSELYTAVLEKEPENEQAALGRVHAMLRLEQNNEALNELKRIRSFSAKPTNIDLFTSRVYLRMQNFSKANALLEGILAHEESSTARYLLAIIRYQNNKKEAALAHLKKITKADGEFEDGIALQVRILNELSRSTEALNLVKKLINNPKQRRPVFYSILAGIYVSQHRRGEAAKVFVDGTSLYPENATLFFEYGLFLEQEGRQKEAITSMEKALNLQADHVEALNYLGYTWADNNIHLEKALEYIQKANSLKPNNGYILDSLSWVYFRLGELDKASSTMDQALALIPEDPNILDHAGDIHWAAGHKNKAREAWRKAMNLFKEKAMKEKMKKKLDGLQ